MLLSAHSLPKVKICGLRQPEHVQTAVQCGADAVGLMFYPPSPRHLTAPQARKLAATVRGEVDVVGVFVDPSPEYLTAVLSAVSLDFLQFHGSESNAFCDSWGLPWLKAVAVQGGDNVEQAICQWPDAEAIVLDSQVAGQSGGTGQVFDWAFFPHCCSRPLMVAGGLSPANVAAAVTQLKPWGIDVSSGVERRRGDKSHTLIRQFMEEVNRVRS